MDYDQSAWLTAESCMDGEEVGHPNNQRYYPSYPTASNQSIAAAANLPNGYASNDAQMFLFTGVDRLPPDVQTTLPTPSSISSYTNPESMPREYSNNVYVSPFVLNTDAEPGSTSPTNAMTGPYMTSISDSYYQTEADMGRDWATDSYLDAPEQLSKRPRQIVPDAPPPVKKHNSSKSVSFGDLSQTSMPDVKSPTIPDKARSSSTGHDSMPPPSLQLRTASRKSKKASASYRPATSPEEERARSSHNNVEKQYRNRLNQHFEQLLAVLPIPVADAESEKGSQESGEGPPVDGDRRLSKAEVLEIARQHIHTLEKETSELRREKQRLLLEVETMRQSGAYPRAAYASDGTDNSRHDRDAVK